MKEDQKDWENLIALFLNKDKAMTPAEFCMQHGVSIYEMDLHYKEYIKGQIPTKKPACVEITGSERKASYFILDISGVRIKVNEGFDPSLLKSILEVLQC